MLVFVHIPKNAGRSVMRILHKNFGDAVRFFHTDRKAKFLTDAEFVDMIENFGPGVQALVGHDFRPLPPRLAGQLGIQYFTLIRHPIDRLLSLYYYEQRMEPDKPLTQLPFPEYLEARAKIDRAMHNFQCLNLCDESTCSAAIERLEHFPVVGISDRFEDSLRILRHKLGLPSFEVECEPDNVSSNRKLWKETLDPDIYRRVESMNQEDMRLYEYARVRFERDWNALTCGSEPCHETMEAPAQSRHS